MIKVTIFISTTKSWPTQTQMSKEFMYWVDAFSETQETILLIQQTNDGEITSVIFEPS